MAKIIDPDFLDRDVTIVYYTSSNASGSKTILINRTGVVTFDGVTGQCVYSKCKELWKSEADLIKFPFPLISITEKKFDFINSWDWYDYSTKTLIRDAGWSVKDASLNSLEEWMGFITLGTLGSTDQVYYQQSSSLSSSNNVFTGSVNNAVQIFKTGSYGGIPPGASTTASFDYRDYFKCFVREFQKTYDQSQLSAIGETTVTYQVYSFPLTNGADPKITHFDGEVATGSAYLGIDVSYLTASVSRTIGAGIYQFDTIIDANGASKEEVYEKIQYFLRQNIDINSASVAEGIGYVAGKTADELLAFIGDTLQTSEGVYVDNIADTDINFYQFFDTSSTSRTFPYVAAGTIAFNDNLQNDVSGSYKMFFTSTPTSQYGSGSAIIVNDNTSLPITGSTYLTSSRTFTFDYDGNVQGGRTSGADAPVTIVALGLTTAQYVSSVGTIARTNANAFSLVAALERNYSNPA
jgi:hypothetical protein